MGERGRGKKGVERGRKGEGRKWDEEGRLAGLGTSKTLLNDPPGALNYTPFMPKCNGYGPYGYLDRTRMVWTVRCILIRSDRTRMDTCILIRSNFHTVLFRLTKARIINRNYFILKYFKNKQKTLTFQRFSIYARTLISSRTAHTL